MAITQTGAIYKSLSFDNTSSRSYGVYITGEAVYNAPERAVEMISIPGRNGAFALDQGRFENIEVSYPAGIFADNEADFAAAISDFRNFLCSKKGYCRLTDEYNPSEYRMAVYKSGLEVDPAQLRAGEFTITFECKPQRWLTSGETATAVASGGSVTNPTLFESSPLLEVYGYGEINFNGYNLELDNVPLGEIKLNDGGVGFTYNLSNTSDLNAGDIITVSGAALNYKYYYRLSDGTVTFTSVGVNSCTGVSGCSASASYSTGLYNGVDYRMWFVTTNFPTYQLVYGTSSTATITTVSKTLSGTAITATETFTLSYDGSSAITFSYTHSETKTADVTKIGCTCNAITGYSTKALLYNIYCDCDTGEFYRIENGEMISMNNVGDFGANLPVLAPGSNTITYDNTFTTFKVTPRWWKV